MQLQTKRFVIRDFEPADAQEFLVYHADPRSSEFYKPHESTREHAVKLVSMFLNWADELPRRNYQFAVVLHSHRNDMVGCVGLRSEGHPQNEAEFGIEISPKYRGRFRFAIEIADEMLNFGFEKLKLKTITGRTVSDNIRIRRLATWYDAETLVTGGNDKNELHWRLTRDRWHKQMHHRMPKKA